MMEAIPTTHTNRIGKRGAWVVPATLRQRYGLKEGTLVIAEPRPDGILLKPAIASPALSTEAVRDTAWKEWFELMEKIQVGDKEIQHSKMDGRR